MVESWLRVRELSGSILDQGLRHTKDGKKKAPIAPLFSNQHLKRNTSHKAIIPSLRALWKIDLNVDYRYVVNFCKNKIISQTMLLDVVLWDFWFTEAIHIFNMKRGLKRYIG